MAPELPVSVRLYDVRLDRPGPGGRELLASAVTEQEAMEVVADYGPDDTYVSIHTWASQPAGPDGEAGDRRGSEESP
jgi:hypothetical protein